MAEEEPGEEVDEATDPIEDAVAEPTGEHLFGVPVTRPVGQTVLHASVENYLGLITELRDHGFEQVIDLVGVDYLSHVRSDLGFGVVPERFEVVVNMLSLSRRERVRIRLQVADGTPVPTLFDLYPGTEAMEREAFDMFGMEFSDHPDLSRILMPETWDGHPLRKDYDVGRIPVQFKGAPSQR